MAPEITSAVNIRTSILLLAILALISGYVFFVDVSTQPPTEDESPWLYNVDMDDMNRFTITVDDEQAVFSAIGNGLWQMEKPEGGIPVAGERWAGIELILSGPKTRRLLDSEPDDLAPYGLDSPTSRIEIELKDGRIIPLVLGLETPDEGNQYAQVDGFQEVFTVYSGWGHVLGRLIQDPPYPKWYYQLDTSQLTHVALRANEQEVSLTKGVSLWTFNDTNKTKVDDETLSHIMTALGKPTSQKVIDYQVYDDGLAAYGLDTASLTIFLITGHVENEVTYRKEYLIWIGNENENATGYYGRSSQDTGKPDIYEVDSSWVLTLLQIIQDNPHIDDAELD